MTEMFVAIEAHAIDTSRVFIVAEGSGVQVAFDLACRAPGIVRGALLVDGPIHPSLSAESARTAAAAGSIVRLVPSGALDERSQRRSDLCRRYFEHCGFGASVLVESATSEPQIEEALAQLLAAPPVRR